MYSTAFMGLMGGGNGGNLFAATPYTGNGGTQSIVTRQNLAAGGLVWGKETGSIGNHEIGDSIRGANKQVYPNLTNAENSLASITAYNSNGFTVGTGDGLNANGDSLVAFSWLEQAGYMDVVTYTGNGSSNRQISHALAATPKLIIVKCRSASSSWVVGHESATWTKWGQLESTAAFQNATSEWNNTAPTSSVFTVGNSSDVNANGATYVAYLFAEKAGKSKFGSYSGTGASNALTGFGFSPKFFMAKRTDSTGNWVIQYLDGSTVYTLFANTTAARSSALSTFDAGGVTLGSSSFINASGGTYIYAAWG